MSYYDLGVAVSCLGLKVPPGEREKEYWDRFNEGMTIWGLRFTM